MSAGAVFAPSTFAPSTFARPRSFFTSSARSPSFVFRSFSNVVTRAPTHASSVSHAFPVPYDAIVFLNQSSVRVCAHRPRALAKARAPAEKHFSIAARSSPTRSFPISPYRVPERPPVLICTRHTDRQRYCAPVARASSAPTFCPLAFQ